MTQEREVKLQSVDYTSSGLNLQQFNTYSKLQSMTKKSNKINKLAKSVGLDIVNVSWEDTARFKWSKDGPNICDMTLNIGNYPMPIIRQSNFSDKTWDIDINKIPIVVGNEESVTSKLKTISLKQYLANIDSNYSGFHKKDLNLLREGDKDKHILVSTQACFLPIKQREETEFNIKLFNRKASIKSPRCLVIISTKHGSSISLINKKPMQLLFNSNTYKSLFVAERLSFHREKKKMDRKSEVSAKEKQSSVIQIIQIPLEETKSEKKFNWFSFPTGISKMKGNKESTEDNVEYAIIKTKKMTLPMCSKCGNVTELLKIENSSTCTKCKRTVEKNSNVCNCKKCEYIFCFECCNEMLQFHEMNGFHKIIKRDEKYPIRLTFQYYKATDNGIVSLETLKSIKKELESIDKNAICSGSLVTEENNERKTQWKNETKKVKQMKKEEKKEENIVTNESRNIKSLNAGYENIIKGLHALNLLRYFTKFRQEEIDDSCLEFMDEETIQEIFDKAGPRMKFKNWLKKYKQNLENSSEI